MKNVSNKTPSSSSVPTSTPSTPSTTATVPAVPVAQVVSATPSPTSTTVVATGTGGQASEAANDIQSISSLEELLSYEDYLRSQAQELIDELNYTREEITDTLEEADAAFLDISDELNATLAVKAREVFQAVSPKLSDETKASTLYIENKDEYEFVFGVCMGSGVDEEHRHVGAVNIPVSAMLLEGADWKKFVEIAPFLNEHGLLTLEASHDSCPHCAATNAPAQTAQ